MDLDIQPGSNREPLATANSSVRCVVAGLNAGTICGSQWIWTFNLAATENHWLPQNGSVESLWFSVTCTGYRKRLRENHWLPQMVLLSLLLRAGKNTIPFKLGLTKRNSQMPHPNSATNNQRIPLAYLITFRSYGTWLHGDERGSVDRFHNVYGTPRLPPN